MLHVTRQRLPYLLTIGILSAVLLYVLGTGGSAQNPELLASMCNPKGLWILLPILLLLIICFRTNDLLVGVTYAIVVGIIIGTATGLFRFPGLTSIQYETQGLYDILFDGLSGVVDITISIILPYGLIVITVEGGMMEKCCNYLTSRKALQYVGGAEAMIPLGVDIVNILLAGCVLPSIPMSKDTADTIGKKVGISSECKSIPLTAMTTNITATIPTNSAFVTGAATVINQLAVNHAYLPAVTPFQIFLSSYYRSLLTLICGIWVVPGAGGEGEHKYNMTYHHAKG